MLFEPEHFGQPISIELSEYLKEYTDGNDRANVSTKTGVGTSTIRDVVNRYNSLTESNSQAILELMKVAVLNCTNKLSRAKKAKEYLEDKLNPETV